MFYRCTICLLALILISKTASAAEPQEADAIRFLRDKKVLYLNAADVAKSLALELKIVDPQRLVTFCKTKDGGYCIPIRLVADNHRRDGEQLLLAVDVVSQALRFRVVETANKVTIVPQPARFVREGQIAAPGYNAPWGPGRGFREGDTLPDIPFADVAGNEVRFSQFLGKRYILYCWASW
jgi:hypothetical protein